MIEGLDRSTKTMEQHVAAELLKAVEEKASPFTVRHLGRLYDALPVQDRQIRDGLDDALLCAGWERVA